MTAALLRATPDVLARLGVEVTHHFGGGVYAKEAFIPAGARLVQHSHPHAHLSILASGRVLVRRGHAVADEFAGPACITILAGVMHEVAAITDAVWFCCHATDDTDPATVDGSILHG